MNHRIGGRYRHKTTGYVGRLLAIDGQGRLILRVRDNEVGDVWTKVDVAEEWELVEGSRDG